MSIRQLLFFIFLPLAVAAQPQVGSGIVLNGEALTAGSSQLPVLRQKFVNRGGLRPELKEALKQLGDRLERPGKERLTLTGSLNVERISSTVLFRLIWEFPGRLRLDEASNQQTSTTVFDGAQLRKSGTSQATELVESLLFDTPEHFFIAQANGAATRFLGDHFRSDDGAEAHYTGPYHNIYLVTDQVSTRVTDREQLKLYYFNSQTLLLEKVKYETKQSTSVASVEVQYTNWTNQGGQQVPGMITWYADEIPVATLTISSATVSAQLNDGAFVLP